MLINSAFVNNLHLNYSQKTAFANSYRGCGGGFEHLLTIKFYKLILIVFLAKSADSLCSDFLWAYDNLYWIFFDALIHIYCITYVIVAMYYVCHFGFFISLEKS